MKVVLDTNVLVSALLTPNGTCARIVRSAIEGRFTALLDERILDEYHEVLHRREFDVDPDPILAFMSLTAIAVKPSRTSARLPDPDDAPFVEVALAGGADAIVTGNKRHFPPVPGLTVLSPAEFLRLLGGDR